MKAIRFIIVFILSVFFSSCDFLELEPNDFVSAEQYYKTESDLEAALSGVYSTLASGSLYKSYMIGRLGLDADQGYDNRGTDVGTVSDYNVSPTDVKILKFWQDLYLGINNANILLEQINKKEIVMPDSVKQRIVGETLFLRGYFYFLLVSNFGDVPLVLNSNDSSQPFRTPALQVYDKIIQDMDSAALKVNDISALGFGGRVTKSVVYGILTRVHLFVAGIPYNQHDHYEKARLCAKTVIDLNFHKLNSNFQQVFINYAQDIYDTKESLWEVEFYGNGIGLYANLGGYVGGNNGIRNTFDLTLGYTYDFINVTAFAYNVYKTGDLRRDFTIAPFYYKQPTVPAQKVNWSSTQIFNRNCGKFRREYETLEPKHRSYTPQNFPLLRYSDVLLMYAEAVNAVNNGPTTEAYDAINQVRRRGFGKDISTPEPTIDLSGLDYDGFLAEVQNERSRELAFECLRKGDLVRWGIFFPKMKKCLEDANAAPTFTDLKLAKSTFTNVSARDVVWPIPSYEIGVNPNLTQNNGW